jgi:hypothetical protein
MIDERRRYGIRMKTRRRKSYNRLSSGMVKKNVCTIFERRDNGALCNELCWTRIETRWPDVKIES